MADVELAIVDALLDRLNTALSPPLQIAWPNKPFVPPPSEPYLRATVLPGQPTSIAVGSASENRHVGFMQVDVFWPSGQGIADAIRTAQHIVSHFRRGTDITTSAGFKVQINRPPYVMPDARDGAHHIVPVRIFYLADAPNAA